MISLSATRKTISLDCDGDGGAQRRGPRPGGADAQSGHWILIAVRKSVVPRMWTL